MPNPATSPPAPSLASPPPCITGCATTHHHDDAIWVCASPAGSMTIPGQRIAEPADVTVRVVRDLDRDGSPHDLGVTVTWSSPPGVVPPGEARALAALIAAAADRAERVVVVDTFTS